MYAEFAEWLAGEEVRKFFDSFGGQLPTGEAADVASKGIDLINQLFGLLHVRAVMNGIERVNQPIADNPEKEKGGPIEPPFRKNP
jgi:hypothetical protein